MSDIFAPPHSIESEQSIIGMCLLDPSIIDDVASELKPGSFYNTNHRNIFESIVTCHESGSSVDFFAVADHLDGRGLLSETGMVELAELAGNVPSAVNVMSYVKIVKDHATRRDLITIGQKITAMAKARDGMEVEEIASASSAMVAVLEDNLASGKTEFNLAEELKKAVESIQISFEGSQVVGVKPCFDDLAAMTRDFLPGQLITIAGLPGSGKTTLAMNIIERNAAIDTRPHVFFSSEMTTTEILHKMISSLSGVEFHRFDSGELYEEHWPMLVAAVERIKKMNLFIFDKEQQSLSYIRSELNRIKKKHGQIAIMAVDYLQIMKAEEGRSRVEEIESLTGGLKAIAKKYQMPVMQLSQLVKSPNGRMELPDNSQLKGSGSIIADSDKIIFSHVPQSPDGEDERRVREIYCTKNRKGQCGMVKLAFQGQFSRFANLTAENMGY